MTKIEENRDNIISNRINNEDISEVEEDKKREKNIFDKDINSNNNKDYVRHNKSAKNKTIISSKNNKKRSVTTKINNVFIL